MKKGSEGKFFDTVNIEMEVIVEVVRSVTGLEGQCSSDRIQV